MRASHWHSHASHWWWSHHSWMAHHWRCHTSSHWLHHLWLLRSWHSLLWLLSLNNWRFLVFCEAKHLVALAATNANAAANDEWHQDENEKESGSCSGCVFKVYLTITHGNIGLANWLLVIHCISGILIHNFLTNFNRFTIIKTRLPFTTFLIFRITRLITCF